MSNDLDIAISICVLDSIRKEVEQYLLQPLLICLDEESRLITKVDKLNIAFYVFHVDLVLKYFDDLINGLSRIEHLERPRELLIILVEHSEVQHIMHEVVDELRGRHNLLPTVFEAYENFVKIFTQLMDLFEGRGYIFIYRTKAILQFF